MLGNFLSGAPTLSPAEMPNLHSLTLSFGAVHLNR
jgi:hypothetical protein